MKFRWRTCCHFESPLKEKGNGGRSGKPSARHALPQLLMFLSSTVIHLPLHLLTQPLSPEQGCIVSVHPFPTGLMQTHKTTVNAASTDLSSKELWKPCPDSHPFKAMPGCQWQQHDVPTVCLRKQPGAFPSIHAQPCWQELAAPEPARDARACTGSAVTAAPWNSLLRVQLRSQSSHC